MTDLHIITKQSIIITKIGQKFSNNYTSRRYRVIKGGSRTKWVSSKKNQWKQRDL